MNKRKIGLLFSVLIVFVVYFGFLVNTVQAADYRAGWYEDLGTEEDVTVVGPDTWKAYINVYDNTGTPLDSDSLIVTATNYIDNNPTNGNYDDPGETTELYNVSTSGSTHVSSEISIGVEGGFIVLEVIAQESGYHTFVVDQVSRTSGNVMDGKKWTKDLYLSPSANVNLANVYPLYDAGDLSKKYSNTDPAEFQVDVTARPGSTGITEIGLSVQNIDTSEDFSFSDTFGAVSSGIITLTSPVSVSEGGYSWKVRYMKDSEGYYYNVPNSEEAIFDYTPPDLSAIEYIKEVAGEYDHRGYAEEAVVSHSVSGIKLVRVEVDSVFRCQADELIPESFNSLFCDWRNSGAPHTNGSTHYIGVEGEDWAGNNVVLVPDYEFTAMEETISELEVASIYVDDTGTRVWHGAKAYWVEDSGPEIDRNGDPTGCSATYPDNCVTYYERFYDGDLEVKLTAEDPWFKDGQNRNFSFWYYCNQNGTAGDPLANECTAQATVGNLEYVAAYYDTSWIIIRRENSWGGSISSTLDDYLNAIDTEISGNPPEIGGWITSTQWGTYEEIYSNTPMNGTLTAQDDPTGRLVFWEWETGESWWNNCESVSGRDCVMDLGYERKQIKVWYRPLRRVTVNSYVDNVQTDGAAISTTIIDDDPEGATPYIYDSTDDYNPNLLYTVTVPATFGGKAFSGWQGCTDVNGTNCTITTTDWFDSIDVDLRAYYGQPPAPLGDPTKVGELRVETSGGTIVLPLFDLTDPNIKSDALRVYDNSAIRALDLLDPSHADASPVRIWTGSEVKAIRKE